MNYIKQISELKTENERLKLKIKVIRQRLEEVGKSLQDVDSDGFFIKEETKEGDKVEKEIIASDYKDGTWNIK